MAAMAANRTTIARQVCPLVRLPDPSTGEMALVSLPDLVSVWRMFRFIFFPFFYIL